MYGLYVWTAVLGTALLALQFLAGVFDFDGGHNDVQLDSHGESHDSSDRGSSLNLKSFRGFAGGMATFGVIGGLSKSLGAGTVGSLVIASAVSVLAYVATAWVIQRMMSTETNGAVRYKDAIGTVGTVYRSIEGTKHSGVVAVSINGMLVHLPAVSNTNRLLKFGERVEILNLLGGVATVAPAESK